MPRLPPPTHSGSYRFSEVRDPNLVVVCEPCQRRGSYAVAELIAAHGDMTLPSFLLAVITPRCTSRNLWGQCKAVYENPPGRVSPAEPA